MKICICGGGNLGHVMAGYLSAQNNLDICILTTQPQKWSETIEVVDCRGNVFAGKPKLITSSPSEAVGDAEMVLVCLPGFAIHDVLTRIAPYIQPNTWVGTIVSSTGFFFEAMTVFPSSQPLFGFQRVPFISRVLEYGKKAELKGYKDKLSIAVENTEEKEKIRAFWEKSLNTPVLLLKSYYEVSLSNSNPLLHPSRLYSLWSRWEPGIIYDNVPLFYEDWTDEASQYLILMDEELQQLLEHLPVQKGSIQPILEYYESYDAPSLTKKIRSITAFKGIKSPMTKNDVGYVPDFRNRYFTEDIPFGMRFIVETGRQFGLPMPITNTIYEWGMRCVNKGLRTI